MNLKGKGELQYTLSSKPLAAGGEGKIFDISGKPDLVAKIYKPGKTSIEKERKLVKMAAFPPHPSIQAQIAWPQDVLYGQGQFVGFTMPKMPVNEDLNVIYEFGSSAKYPNMPWGNRIIIAENLCAVLHGVHTAGHICGDFNPKNISVNPNTGHIMFLDTDSYHITDGRDILRCDVGMPEYLPVEIQMKMRDGTLATAILPTFSQYTDNFALAIHIFQILMNGVHPFACAIIPSQSSVTAPQPSDNIIKGEFPFMTNLPGIKIPVFAPPITILPQNLQSLFKRAFIDGHLNPSIRPGPAEWHGGLRSLRNELKHCDKVKHHQYYKTLSKCPWCAVELAFSQPLQPKATLKQTAIKPPSVTPPSNGTLDSSSYSAPNTGGTPPRNGKKKFIGVAALIALIIGAGAIWHFMFNDPIVSQFYNPTAVGQDSINPEEQMELAAVIGAEVADTELEVSDVSMNEQEMESVEAQIAKIVANSNLTRDYDVGITELKDLLDEFPGFRTEINAEIERHTEALLRTVEFSLDRESIELAPRESTNLSISSEPPDIENIQTTWSSADTDIATVDDNGRVSAQSVGSTEVILSSLDGTVLATSTVRVFQPPEPLNRVAPIVDRGFTADVVIPAGRLAHEAWTTAPTAAMMPSVNFGGIVHGDVLVYRSGDRQSTSGVADHRVTVFTLHNLDASYSLLSGFVGRVDLTRLAEATLNIYGDETLLESISIGPDVLIPVSVPVENVRQLRIEFVFPQCHDPEAVFAFDGFLGDEPVQDLSASLPPQQGRAALNTFAPYYERGFIADATRSRWDSPIYWNSSPSSSIEGSVIAGGNAHRDVMRYRSGTRAAGNGHLNDPTVTVYTMHNLRGQSKMLSGYVGRIETSGRVNAVMNIIGDGALLHSVPINALDTPISFSVSVENVNRLRVEFVFPHCTSPYAAYFFQGTLSGDG